MFKNLSLLVALVLFSVATTFAQKLPNIHILATGGTIAGTGASSTGTNYTAGQVAIGTLLSAVPEKEGKKAGGGQLYPFCNGFL